jgi:hypothetical protein
MAIPTPMMITMPMTITIPIAMTMDRRSSGVSRLPRRSPL